MTHPVVIDLAKAPYNVVPDWNGSDVTATNWTTAFDDACAELSQYVGPGSTIDVAATTGGVITCSEKGVMMLDAGRVLPVGVSFEGASKYTTTLKMTDASDPTKHFISLGSPTTGQANFGSKIRNCKLYTAYVTSSTPRGVAMVYSNNNQDTTDMMEHLIIFAGARAAIWYETGWGGATAVDCRDIQAVNHLTINPTFHFDGTDMTSFRLDLLEASNALDPATGHGVENSIGLEIGSGRFTVTRFHPEYLHQGVRFKMDAGKAALSDSVGHNTVPYFAVIENRPGQLNKITMKDIGIGGGVTVNNLQPGGSNVYGSIDAERRF